MMAGDVLKLDGQLHRAHRHTLAVGRVDGDFARAAFAGFAGAAESEALMLVADLATLDFDPADVVGQGAPDRLRFLDAAGAYDAFAGLDASALLSDWNAVLDGVLSEGYSGLRVVADNTPLLAASGDEPERWLSWEQCTDAWQAQRPVAGTCFVDARHVDPALLASAAHLHPAVAGTAGPRWRAVHDVVNGRPRLVVAGALELWDADDLAAALTREGDGRAGDPLEVELSRISYLHHVPLRVLLAARDSGRVRLVAIPATMRRQIDVLDHL